MTAFRPSHFGWRHGDAHRTPGQALVEFALVAPFLFALLLGTIEAGRFIFLYELLNNATREGARYAIVNGADSRCPSGPPAPGTAACDPTGENIKARVHEAAISILSMGELSLPDPVWTAGGSVLVDASPGDQSTGTNARGEYVTVFLDFTYRPLIAEVVDIALLPDITINVESTLVVNY